MQVEQGSFAGLDEALSDALALELRQHEHGEQAGRFEIHHGEADDVP